jgi:hypothetical protein
VHCHVDILNPIDYPGWDELLISSQGYNFFHTSAWAKVLCETYHYRPVYFALLDGSKFLALAPMMEVKSIFTGIRGVCLPFTDHCEFISDSGSQAEDIIDSMKEYAREHRWQFIELRCGNYPNQTPAASFYGHILDLTVGPEQLFRRLRSDERSGIRKAIREGVKVSIHRSAGAIKEFYRLQCITRKRHGLPPQPYSFFQKVYEHVISKNLGLIILACHSNMNIAGAVYFGFGDKSIYKFAASDYAHQHLRANNLVMWEAIKYYAGNGYRSMCLGRTELDNLGLRKFKMNWGANERILNYYRYDLRREAFVAETQVVRNAYHHIFRAMPIPLLRLCGSLLYKHIG